MLRYDERILTKLYADGQRIVIKLIDDEASGQTSVTINNVVLEAPEPEEMWRFLTCLTREQFDRHLLTRFSEPRLAPV